MMRSLCIFNSLVMCIAITASKWVQAADTTSWESLIPAIEPNKAGVTGSWRKQDGGLLVNAAQGARLTLPARPTGEYDFKVSFTRRTGKDSIALFIVSGGKQTSFEVDAWGQNLAGLQLMGGKDLRENSTRVSNQALQNGRRYTVELRVRKYRVEALLDDKPLLTHRSNGSDFSMLDLWRMPNANALGIAAWDSETLFHSIEVRKVSGELNLDSSSAPTTATVTQTTKPMPPPTTTPTPGTGTNPTIEPASNAKRPRVLMVIANMHFFYREYSEPRQELERAGCIVEVAAGRKVTCYPHNGTGEGADRGAVNPDLAIADANAARYDALLFSGGWGSSMYQYAFQGTYNNATYNGDRRARQVRRRPLSRCLGAGVVASQRPQPAGRQASHRADT